MLLQRSFLGWLLLEKRPKPRPRPYPKRKPARAERDAVAASSRAGRALVLVALVAFPSLVIAALHLAMRSSHWLPRVLS